MALNISEYQERIIAQKVVPERQSIYSDFPSRMLPTIKDYLIGNGIERLYCHQVEMFDKALDGENIVITTSTASGKTLSFLLPIIQEILQDPRTRAIFVYPTKALASDQYRNISPLLSYFGKNKIQAGIYDGDTPVNERSRIRNSANIILTNPEMINAAFLPHHNNYGFNFVFSNLKYIVTDELHSYRGAFGAHLSNIFRRLFRVCKYYNSSPKFLCSSATIANPIELAKNICGKEFTLINTDGSPAPEKHYYLWQPPIYKNKNKDYRVSPAEEAAEIIPYAVMQKSNFITFCKARKTVEVVLKEARDKLKYDGVAGQDYGGVIAGYRGGYKPEERKEIENKMITGKLRGLVSTNSLELGIDIGKIDTVIIVGFPGTRASFWQQSGRAGRKGNTASTVLILDNLPLDQYLAINSEWLFSSGLENAVVDRNNLFIQLAHVRAAAAEIPLSLDDAIVFPDLGEIVPVLINSKELKNAGGCFVWCGRDFPAGDYSLRNIDNKRYKLKNTINDAIVTEMDELQAFLELYEGAIYIHEGLQYQVEKLCTDGRLAEAKPIDVNFYTDPFKSTSVTKIKELKNFELGRTRIGFGDVKVTNTISGYVRIQFHNHQNLGSEKLQTPLEKTFDTEGMWFLLPHDVCAVYDKQLPNTGRVGDRSFWKSYYGGMSFSLLNAAMMITMTTKGDISSSSLLEILEDKRLTSICIFDMYTGGLGFAEKVYDYAMQIIDMAIEMINGCKCKDGCPACVGDYNLDKRVVLWGLKSLIEKLDAPVDVKIPDMPKQIIVEKPFKFESLQADWGNFIQYVKATGEYLTGFLSTVENIQIDGVSLTLLLKNDFYQSWLLDDTNKIKLVNTISRYVELPVNFTINTETISYDGSSKSNKIAKRYNDLVK